VTVADALLSSVTPAWLKLKGVAGPDWRNTVPVRAKPMNHRHLHNFLCLTLSVKCPYSLISSFSTTSNNNNDDDDDDDNDNSKI